MKYFGNQFFDKAEKANGCMILVSCANTKYCHFQGKNNCSKFITDRLQQRCHLTFLIYIFVASTQPPLNIPGIFAVRSLNVAMFGTSRQRLENILKKNFLKVLDGKSCFCVERI